MTELELALQRLGQELEVPEAPDLVLAVHERLEPRGRQARARRRWVLAVAVAALAILGATLAIPDARSAFLRVLSIGGERVEIVDELPEVEVAGGLESMLGERVTLEQAREASDFGLRTLDEAPDRVYLGERGTVWFLHGTPDDVRLLVAQTPLLAVDEPALRKKVLDGGTRVESVRVNGAEGLFLSGESHFLFLVDEHGNAVESSARLAEDVLIWDDGGVAYRLEGDLELARALELARSLSPSP
jgi:hypothetical protein